MLEIFKIIAIYVIVFSVPNFASGQTSNRSSEHRPSAVDQQKLGLQLAHTVLRGVQWPKMDQKTPGCLVPAELPNVSPQLERNDEEILQSPREFLKRFLLVDRYDVVVMKSRSVKNPFTFNDNEDTFLFQFAVRAKKGKRKGYISCKAGGYCKIIKHKKDRQIFTIKVALGLPNRSQVELIGRTASLPLSRAVHGLTAMMMNSDVVDNLRVLPKKCARK